jgi:hypothetical protein
MKPACAPPLLKKATQASVGGLAGSAAEADAAATAETRATTTAQRRCRNIFLSPQSVNERITLIPDV